MSEGSGNVGFRAVATFYVLSLAFSWGWWGALLWRGVDAPSDWSSSHLPGLFGPALAAVIACAICNGRSGAVGLLHSIIKPWERMGLVLAAIVAPPLLALLVLAIRGQPLVPAAIWAYPGVPAGVGPVVGLLAALLLNGVGEETGWRGYLLPRLMPLGRIRATLLVAALWAFWHLPAFLLPFGLGAQVSGMTIIGWAFGLICGAFVLSWLWLVSGQALGTVVLWHLLFNYATATPATSGMVAAIVSTFVMIWGVLICIAWLRRR